MIPLFLLAGTAGLFAPQVTYTSQLFLFTVLFRGH